MADTVQACFSMISASLVCFSAAFCSEINNYIISMGFGGPNHWRCSGKTTLVARHEGRQLQANSDQDKTLWFLYPSSAHTKNHSILSGLLISLSISNTIVTYNMLPLTCSLCCSTSALEFFHLSMTSLHKSSRGYSCNKKRNKMTSGHSSFLVIWYNNCYWQTNKNFNS